MNKIEIYTAPMAGVSDYTFRRLVEEFNPDLIFTEMINVSSLNFNREKLSKILKLRKNNVVQIFGNDVNELKKGAKFIESLGVNHINLNCGCPMKKITSSGNGAALLKNPEKIYEILSELREVLSKDTKISLKIRLGYEIADSYLKIAKIAEKLNCDHITIHGRTRKQGYQGISNWDAIKEVKENVNIKVIGNGDIFDAITARNKINYSKVDGIMLARGIQGNFWLINQIREILEFGEIRTIVSDEDRIKMALKHLNMYMKDNDNIFYPDIRKYLIWYLEKTYIKDRLDEILLLTSYEEMERKIIFDR